MSDCAFERTSATEQPFRGGDTDRRVSPWVVETDGGERTVAGGFETYTDNARGYTVAYPADWSVETDASGVAFDAPGPESAGAEVFVDDVSGTLSEYVEDFFGVFDADEHVHDVERSDGHDVWFSDGQRGHTVECAYVGDTPDERWRLSYLFVVADGTGYTVGVDWDAAVAFGSVAERIVTSFELDGNKPTVKY